MCRAQLDEIRLFVHSKNSKNSEFHSLFVISKSMKSSLKILEGGSSELAALSRGPRFAFFRTHRLRLLVLHNLPRQIQLVHGPAVLLNSGNKYHSPLVSKVYTKQKCVKTNLSKITTPRGGKEVKRSLPPPAIAFKCFQVVSDSFRYGVLNYSACSACSGYLLQGHQYSLESTLSRL